MTTRRKVAKKAKPAKKKKASARRTPRAAMAVATSSKKPTQQRVAALAEAPLAVCESDENLQAMLKILRDKKELIKVRLAALQSLQAASFSVIAFESCRGDYMAALREVMDDPDPELRQRVLGILARENDAYVQQRLLDGLQSPDNALVAPEKALQLLSYDIHAEAYPVAREIVSNPPSPEAKREALRILSADAASAPVFEKLMLDKEEDREIRQISAAAYGSILLKHFTQSSASVLT